MTEYAGHNWASMKIKDASLGRMQAWEELGPTNAAIKREIKIQLRTFYCGNLPRTQK